MCASQQTQDSEDEDARPPRNSNTPSVRHVGGFLVIVAALLAVSGVAALVYQLVWFQLLGLVLGSSAVSLGVLLATFMGGLCLGSVLLPRCVSRRRDPLRIFAVLELAVGAIGLCVLYAMPLIADVYGAWANPGIAGLTLRAAVAALCLLPPTVLMGATLPAVSRWVETTSAGVAWLGAFYAANVAGAVVGCLFAGFYLLRVHDVGVATFTAAALNVLVAAICLFLAHRRPEAEAALTPASAGSAPTLAEAAGDASLPAIGSVHVVIALSGMTALAAEVVWTRQLSLLLGATVYTFALILAVFLLGLGLGSGAGAALSRRLPPRTALGCCQLALCAAVAWAAFALWSWLPFWPLDVTLATPAAAMLQIDLLRTAFAILPAALLWGASFPLALAAARAPGRDPARLVGRLYAANTVGAIAGALGAAFVLVAWLGSQQTLQVLIVVSAVSGLLALAGPGLARRARGRVIAAAVVAIAAALAFTVPRPPAEFIAYGRFTPTRGQGANVIYTGEGLTASVAVSEDEAGVRSFHSAGKAQASGYPQDMRLQRMLGHLTTLAADEPGSILVIGLGAGITAGAASIDPGVERVVVAEIEPLVPAVAARYFDAENHGVATNPKVEIRIDDGRHVLSTTTATFDGITSDPLDPWVRGAAALYTAEFWRLARSRLNPGGAITVFVQLYESTEAAVKSEVATFFEVFPQGGVFANTVEGRGYDVVLLARADGTPIDLDRMHARLQSRSYEPVARSLREVGFNSAADLLGTYVGGREELAAWLQDAAINRDRNLRLQYLAGQGLNIYAADAIFDNMTSGPPRFPEALFTGSPLRLEELRQRMRALPRDF